jgi:hypothetical protein
MVDETSRANIRVSEKARDVLKRYGKLHGWSIGETVEQIAETIVETLDLLKEESLPVNVLRKYYGRSGVFAVADMTTIFQTDK